MLVINCSCGNFRVLINDQEEQIENEDDAIDIFDNGDSLIIQCVNCSKIIYLV